MWKSLIEVEVEVEVLVILFVVLGFDEING